MTLWRLEWVRLIRTGRVLILLAVFLSMGIIGPLSVRYLPELLEAAGSGEEAIRGLPPVSPQFAMASFLGNAIQLGVLAIAFVGASALAIDAKPEISVFFRSRATIRQILGPRFLAISAAAVVAFFTGVTTAVVASGVLIDWPDVGTTVVASSLVALYLVFVVSLIALFGSVVRRVSATALLTIGSVIVLGVVGLYTPIEAWMPSYLVGGFDGIIGGGDFIYWRAIAASIALIAGALWLAVARLENREV